MLRESDYPALLLNADMRPMSYAPLSTIAWKDAISNVLAGSYAAVAEYDRVVRSPAIEVRLPSVVMSRTYVNLMSIPVPLTRLNLMLASDHRCAYCGEDFRERTELLTFDHVLPRARGGETSYENILIACAPCNQRKGCRTPAESGMRSLWRPRRPGRAEIERKMLQHRRRVQALHESWEDFVYWDGVLEKEAPTTA